MLRIFDCSNSVWRPLHRGGGGSKRNAVMQALETHAAEYGCRFVHSLEEAELAVTNDVFPPDVLRRGLPLFKRMDGVFFLEPAVVRNTPLNEAARQAQAVVFISEYSRRSYFALYGEPLGEHHVVLNAADGRVFPKKGRGAAQPRTFIAAATHWGRAEKRLPAVLDAARYLTKQGCSLLLVGNLPNDLTLPAYVQPLGYLEPVELSRALARADGLLNFSYRDAAPKVVAEAIACGLPVLYADSGGTPELVGKAGVGVMDPDPLSVQALVPELPTALIEDGARRFLEDYTTLAQVAHARPDGFSAMLEGYFTVIRGLAR